MSDMTFGVLLAAAIDVNYLCVEAEGKDYELHISKDWQRGIIILSDGCVKFDVQWKDDGTEQVTLLNMDDAENMADGFKWIGADEHLELAQRIENNWEGFQNILWNHIDNRRDS